jgi:hypothetical protein
MHFLLLGRFRSLNGDSFSRRFGLGRFRCLLSGGFSLVIRLFHDKRYS